MPETRSRRRHPRARDRRALIDLCYRLDLDDAAFLAETCAWWPRLGSAGPLGVLASSMRLEEAGGIGIDPVYHGLRETFDAFRVVFAATDEHLKAMMLWAHPMFATASILPRSESGLAVSMRYGAPDFLGFLAPTGTGHVLVVGTPVEHHVVVHDAERAALGACASHLAASWRLRRRLLAEDRWEDRAEAVALPDGRVVHAVGEAREPGALATIRRTVRARERARSGLRVDAQPLWPELVAGRWTLVDSFDHDGRRYVVAWRNPPDAPRRRLSPRACEVLARTARGESTKAIAAALGTGEAAVSMVLHEGMALLRIARVGDLIRLGEEADLDTVFRDETLWAAAMTSPARPALDGLTRAEREVLAELMRGASNAEIAARRNRSLRTVANQVASVFAKLGVDSRRGLLARLARR